MTAWLGNPAAIGAARTEIIRAGKERFDTVLAQRKAQLQQPGIQPTEQPPIQPIEQPGIQPNKAPESDYLSFESSEGAHPLSGYLGNKKTMLDAGAYNDIIPEGAKINRIIEPFGGSGLLGNVFHAQIGGERILNDLGDQTHNFHQQVKENSSELLQHLDRLAEELDSLKPETITLETSKNVGRWWNKNFAKQQDDSVAPAAKAAWAAIQNNGAISIMGKNQRIIKSEKGWLRWNISSVTWKNIKDAIIQHARALKNTRIEKQDARAILAQAKTGDLVPVDPPYVSETGKNPWRIMMLERT